MHLDTNQMFRHFSVEAPVANNELDNRMRQMKVAERHLQNVKDAIGHLRAHQERVSELSETQKLVQWKRVAGWLPNVGRGALSMVLHSTPLKQVDQDPAQISVLKSRFFDVAMPENVQPSNQMYSGRCWMFAGLNILRRSLIRANKLKPDFELSQSYLFFWHYFEQYNYMLNLFFYESLPAIEAADMLEKPLHDGGNWITFRRLVCKYGIVPKNLYRESWPTSHSSEMNAVLSNLLRKDVRDCVAKTEPDFREFRDTRLKAVFQILCSFMGAPPMSSIECVFENVQHKLLKCVQTPRLFFDSLNKSFDIEQHIQLVHDMRNVNGWHTTQHQGLRGTPNVIFNVHDDGKMDLWFNCILESIRCGRAVWFACNMSEDVSAKLQGMADKLYDPEKFLNSPSVDPTSDEYNSLEMSKVDRITWGRAKCNHAMLIVGVETKEIEKVDEETKKITKVVECQSFNIENSWGATGPGKGFYKMTAAWFRKHVFTVVIHRAILEKVGMVIPKREEKLPEYPFWDFFG